MQFRKSSPGRLNWGFPSFRARRRGLAAGRQKSARRRLVIEMLEDRAVPASLTIMATPDPSISNLPNHQAIEDTINTAARILDGFLTTTYPTTVSVVFSVMQSSIDDLTIQDAGSGYNPASPPHVRIDVPGGGGTQAAATAVVSPDGKITGFDFDNGGTHGSGYTTIPNVVIDPPPGPGTQATAVAELSGLGASSTFVVSPTYASYLTALSGQLSPSTDDVTAMQFLPKGPNLPAPLGGQDATAVATIDGAGTVNSIVVPAGGGGGGYDASQLPQVFISPSNGGGVQATATAIVDPATGVVTGFHITNAGTDYTVAPVVNVASPGGGADITLTRALATALGIPSPSPAATIYLNLSALNVTRPAPANSTQYDLLSTVLHELSEVLGAGGAGPGLGVTSNPSAAAPPVPSPGALFRYTAPPGPGLSGVLSYNFNPATAAYFSIDGGAHDVFGEEFNNVAGNDYGDWISPRGRPLVQVQDSNARPATAPTLDQGELTLFDVIGYTLNPNLADLKLKITDDVSNTAALNMSWTWTLHVSNDGTAPAVFNNLQRLLVDNLPNNGIGYSELNVINLNGVTGAAMPVANITDSNLTVSVTGADGTDFTIQPGGSFDVVFKATPTEIGDAPNPRPGGVAMVDPDGLVAEDYTNNTASDTVTVTSARYVTFTCDQNISDANAQNVILTGTGIHDGDTVTVSVHDANGPPYDYAGAGPVTVSDGTWFVPNLDASGLSDGWIYWTITEKNLSGSVIGGLSAWPSVKGPPLAFTTAPDINAANVKNITVSGTEAITADPYYADPITVLITDGTVTLGQVSSGADTVTGHFTPPTNADGTWSVSGLDASSLLDGRITYLVYEYSPDGSMLTNITQYATKTTGVLAFTSAPNINDDDKGNVTVTGTGGNGDDIAVTITDGLRTTVVAPAKVMDGTWSVTGIDAAPLADGNVTYNVTQTDSAGNVTMIQQDATKDTTQLALAFTSTPPITTANQFNVAVTGRGVPGDDIVVNITDSDGDGDSNEMTDDADTVVNPDGTWSVSGIDASFLFDGVVTYIATEYDALGEYYEINLDSTKSTGVVPTVAMTAPAGGAVLNDNKPTLSATATDNSGSGIDSVQFELSGDGGTTWNDAGSDVTSEPYSFTFTTALADGSYQARAVATDNDGNDATSAAVTFTIDTVDPTVQMTSPANGSASSNTKPTLSATASDNSGGSGLATVQLEYSSDSGGTWNDAGPALTTGPFSFTFTTALAAGNYQGRAIATDNAGNSATSAVVSFSINTMAPTVAMTAPANDSVTNNNKPTLAATATDNSGSGLAKIQFQYSTDGGSTWIGAGSAETSGPYSLTFPTALEDGTYQADAVATDNDGNSATSTAVSFTIDTVAPTVDMTAPEDGSETTDDMPTLSATASDNTGGSGLATVQFEYSSNAGSTWTDVGSPLTAAPFNYTFTTALADGDYQARAVATDNAGNVATSSAVSFTIGNAAPTVAMTAPANGSSTNNNKPKLSANASEIGGTGLKNVQFQYSANAGSTWNNAGNALTAAPFSFTFTTALADGSYQARAIATDNAGNTDTSPAVSFLIDTVAPTVTMTAPANGTFTSNTTPTLSATASDNTGGSGLAGVQFQYSSNSGSTWTNVGTAQTTAPFSFTFTTALALGTYEARADATDKAGNSATSPTVSFTIGNGTLNVEITAPSSAHECQQADALRHRFRDRRQRPEERPVRVQQQRRQHLDQCRSGPNHRAVQFHLRDGLARRQLPGARRRHRQFRQHRDHVGRFLHDRHRASDRHNDGPGGRHDHEQHHADTLGHRFR